MDRRRTRGGILTRIHSRWIRMIPFSQRKLCRGAHKNSAPNESRKTRFRPRGSRLRFLMCRAIKTLHNFDPPATNDEIRASSLQFVRKLSGFTKPSRANEEAFNRAVDEVAQAAQELLDSLVTNAPPRDREVEAARARARSAER